MVKAAARRRIGVDAPPGHHLDDLEKRQRNKMDAKPDLSRAADHPGKQAWDDAARCRVEGVEMSRRLAGARIGLEAGREADGLAGDAGWGPRLSREPAVPRIRDQGFE